MTNKLRTNPLNLFNYTNTHLYLNSAAHQAHTNSFDWDEDENGDYDRCLSIFVHVTVSHWVYALYVFVRFFNPTLSSAIYLIPWLWFFLLLLVWLFSGGNGINVWRERFFEHIAMIWVRFLHTHSTRCFHWRCANRTRVDYAWEGIN